MSVNIWKTKKTVNRMILYICLILTLLFFIGPFYWIFITSLQEKDQFYKQTPDFIPHGATLNNYENVLGSGHINITLALGNSLRVAIAATLLCIVLGIFAAYAFARLKFRFSNIAFVALIFTQMLPPVSLLLPFFMVFQKLNLTNTLSGLVIFHTAWLLPIATWILYSYYKTIPKDLEEAARIDGASRIGALFKIMVPLSLPGMASAGIICFVFSMGEFMGAVALINKGSVQTVPLALYGFISKYTIDFGGLTASAVLAVIFPVIFVLIFQKFLIKGLTAGAVKE